MLLAEIFDQFAHLPDLVWIETNGRLVENKEFGLIYECIGQTDSLAITFGKCTDQFSLHFAQAAQFLYVADAFGHAAMWHAFKRGTVIKVFRYPHIIIEGNIFRHESRQNPHGRGLARAVRTQKTHDLALADLEIQILDRGLTGVTLG